MYRYDDLEADVPQGLPPPSLWNGLPLCVWDRVNGKVCPIGKPTDFETPVFKGKVLFRVKSPQVPTEPYFEGRKRKYQFSIQGQFKEKINVLDLTFGAEYDRPMRTKPPTIFHSMLKSFLSRTNPGLEIDLLSDKPYIRQNIGSAFQQLLVHEKGEEPPDIAMIGDFEDRTQAFGGKFDANENGSVVPSSMRKQIFATCKCDYDAGKQVKHEYVFEPTNTYTFVLYADSTDFFTYTENCMGLITIDLASVTHAEPYQFACQSKAHNMQRVFDFQIWHTKFFEAYKDNKDDEEEEEEEEELEA
mmetsp:Transcript_6527/g.9501  ORF Transcript_6527/g.9501 Transcript_6527/m.9501 type:complete len:302 (-) Transcript_6527:299-1204(-)|eukprot:CAMPEP_0194049600 /NCGR_PEP_ID=MMETSP0009_2-20130614/30781_1 /TAXON_ID=210454 /ORGANISM="Grammatophora oceanica, Strain CCMP 410" /LENGTH=301 /DNA_ID=CAMNT_0038695801 /DNA_START=60 /DNA_END=965 /DNA_ORIENTATION=-